VFNTAGDGFMLEFGSSLATVEAAGALAEQCEPKPRVGVHLGDVAVLPNGDLLGHGVNVAARLMAQSDPGSVLVSADVHRTIRGPLAARLVSRGIFQLDKMTERIEAFALLGEEPAVVAAPSGSREPLLAVLPFDNLSDDRDAVLLGRGVGGDHPAPVPRRRNEGCRPHFEFSVSWRRQNGAKGCERLKCSHILDGSIRRAGGRVRISAHLVDAALQTTLCRTATTAAWTTSSPFKMRFPRTSRQLCIRRSLASRPRRSIRLSMISISALARSPSHRKSYDTRGARVCRSTRCRGRLTPAAA